MRIFVLFGNAATSKVAEAYLAQSVFSLDYVEKHNFFKYVWSVVNLFLQHRRRMEEAGKKNPTWYSWKLIEELA